MRSTVHPVWKHVIYSAILVFLVIAECTFMRKLAIFGAVPRLVVLYVCALAFFDGAKIGGIYGAVGGYLFDVLCGGGIYYSAAICFVMCWLIAYAVELWFSHSYISYLVCASAFLAVYSIADLFVMAASYSQLDVGNALLCVTLPVLLYSLAVSAVIYFPISLLCASFDRGL